MGLSRKVTLGISAGCGAFVGVPTFAWAHFASEAVETRISICQERIMTGDFSCLDSMGKIAIDSAQVQLIESDPDVAVERITTILEREKSDQDEIIPLDMPGRVGIAGMASLLVGASMYAFLRTNKRTSD